MACGGAGCPGAAAGGLPAGCRGVRPRMPLRPAIAVPAAGGSCACRHAGRACAKSCNPPPHGNGRHLSRDPCRPSAAARMMRGAGSRSCGRQDPVLAHPPTACVPLPCPCPSRDRVSRRAVMRGTGARRGGRSDTPAIGCSLDWRTPPVPGRSCAGAVVALAPPRPPPGHLFPNPVRNPAPDGPLPRPPLRPPPGRSPARKASSPPPCPSPRRRIAPSREQRISASSAPLPPIRNAAPSLLPPLLPPPPFRLQCAPRGGRLPMSRPGSQCINRRRPGMRAGHGACTDFAPGLAGLVLPLRGPTGRLRRRPARRPGAAVQAAVAPASAPIGRRHGRARQGTGAGGRNRARPSPRTGTAVPSPKEAAPIRAMAAQAGRVIEAAGDDRGIKERIQGAGAVCTRVAGAGRPQGRSRRMARTLGGPAGEGRGRRRRRRRRRRRLCPLARPAGDRRPHSPWPERMLKEKGGGN